MELEIRELIDYWRSEVLRENYSEDEKVIMLRHIWQLEDILEELK